MNTKSFLYILPIMMLSLTSCKKTLTESPKSLAVENFYHTPEEFQAALNAIYAPLRSADCLGGLYLPQVESYVDYAYGRGSYGILSQFQGLDPTNITRVQSMWNQFYLSIRNANQVIAAVPNATSISEEQASLYTAEAKFLRALSYFFLVRNWGGVILRTEANATEYAVPRSSAADIYKQIEEDLLYAEQYLPVTPLLGGKPTVGSAKTLLADVYFYEAKYADAAAKADEVIQSNTYSLVPVSASEDFLDVYGPDVITTKEEIFYLKFSKLGSNQGWNAVMFFHAPGSGKLGAGGYYALYTSADNPVYQAWDEADLRKTYNWYLWDVGIGKTTYLSNKFTDPAATGANSASNDYPLYRYADLLLIYAEAASIANNAPTQLAIDRLNMVHRRGYGKDPLNASEVDFKLSDYNLDTFKDLVLKERGYETEMEGKRWLDLKRSGKAKEIIKAATGKDIADKHFLWPIPNSEMSFNEALNPQTDQNTGY
ncbi:Starch-binding associating with outer membrane [bacterium A37T11]|nr:Starch-binding associating with outer membrane [bacterium A37T11]